MSNRRKHIMAHLHAARDLLRVRNIPAAKVAIETARLIMESAPASTRRRWKSGK